MDLVAGLGDLIADELPGGRDVTFLGLPEARERVRRHRGELPVGHGRDAVAVLDALHHGPSRSCHFAVTIKNIGYCPDRGIELRLHVAAGKRHQQGIRGVNGQLQFPAHGMGFGHADDHTR